MVKILETKPDPSVTKITICGHCGAKLEYVPNDVHELWRSTDISGGPNGADGFTCPHCSKQVIIRRW